MRVLLTIDTEVWPRTPAWREDKLASDLERDVWGRIEAGTFGIGYQIDVLNRHGLKAVFFIESLFASEVGSAPLRAIVDYVQEHGHEAQLHVHSEWLRYMQAPLLEGRRGKHLKYLDPEDQHRLIGIALSNLTQAGARRVNAFRAGNYGANMDTLRALAKLGIEYDSSYTLYLGRHSGIDTGRPIIQPQLVEGVREVPVSAYQDWPGHYRHAQLCACSAGEMQQALWESWRGGWKTFVIVSHSFEMIAGRDNGGPPRPRRIVVRRFEQLCQFLARHRDKFETCGFLDLDGSELAAGAREPIAGSIRKTAWRFVEQAVGRVI